MGILSFFGFGKGGIRDALRRGAIVVDVRTAHEFDQGRVPDSINIPVDRIAVSAQRIINMNKPIVLVCSSGHRSGQALQSLKEKGLKDVFNGGDWHRVLRIVKSL